MSELVEKSNYHKKNYLRYCRVKGLKKSVHVPRDQGPDISIMVELVMANTRMFDSTFPGLADLDSDFCSSSSDTEDAASYQSDGEEK